ncbi:MAG: tail-specific protease, partial [Sphingobacteriia bacterium]
MQQFWRYMKQHKGLVLALVVLFGVSFFAFRNVLPLPSNGVTSLQQRLLAAVGSLLEQQHYSPKKINDDFSKTVFKSYLDQMDGDKSLFLQSDIQQLKKYETLIDDELHGAPLQFQPAVSAIYEKRIAEAAVLYKKILSQPFDFNTNESVVLDGDKLKFPTTAAERQDRWRKKLKYYTLERYHDLLEEQEKNAGKPDFKAKSKDSLEAEARSKVLKMMDRMFNRFKTAYTPEQQFNAFVNTVTNTMDPHTDYFPPLEKRAFDERMSNQFYGIGAQLQQDDNGIKIASLVTGGPAWKTGQFTVGDLIVKVGQGIEEQVDISGYAVEDAVKLIRGNKGSEVRLTLKKQDGTYKTIQIVREKIEQDEGLARSAIVQQGEDKIGYISLPDFYANFEDENGFRCSRDVANEIIKLKKENVKGI